MMSSLTGLLSVSERDLVDKLTKLRFANDKRFNTSEALIVYEQNILSEDILFDCCQEELGVTLEKPRVHYLSQEVIDFFATSECVPFELDHVNNKLHVLMLIENKNDDIPMYDDYDIVKHFVPIYYYVDMRTKYYGQPSWLYPLATKDVFSFIIEEAITLGAIDITISSRRDYGIVYYNVRKRKVYSKRSITKDTVIDLTDYISTSSGANFDSSDLEPKYMNTELDVKHRGRTVIKDTVWGKSITIRVFSKDFTDVTLDSLSLDDCIKEFARDKFMDTRENGLRLLVGPTMSGKNTTIIGVLKELMDREDRKICTVEMPVEIYLEGIEQTSVDDEESYVKNSMALLRENPDINYLSEITDRTARTILITANTAKPVYSSLHANDIPGVITRLTDLTDFSIDRVIECMHSVIFQQLERDELNDSLYPINKCFYFSDEVKQDLYGANIGDIRKYFKTNEDKIITSGL